MVAVEAGERDCHKERPGLADDQRSARTALRRRLAAGAGLARPAGETVFRDLRRAGLRPLDSRRVVRVARGKRESRSGRWPR